MCLLGEFWWLLPILIQSQYNYHICKTKNTKQESIKRNGWWYLHSHSTLSVSLIFFLLSITNVFWNLNAVSVMCSCEEFHLHLISLQWLNRILILESYNNFLWNNATTQTWEISVFLQHFSLNTILFLLHVWKRKFSAQSDFIFKKMLYCSECPLKCF